MRFAPWIVAALAIAACYFILSAERDALDDEAKQWRADRDSLIASASRAEQRAKDAEARMDSLRYHTDSIIATFEPETVMVARSLKFFEFAPIGTVQDSLMMP